jgi:hypothetical protein
MVGAKKKKKKTEGDSLLSIPPRPGERVLHHIQLGPQIRYCQIATTDDAHEDGDRSSGPLNEASEILYHVEGGLSVRESSTTTKFV